MKKEDLSTFDPESEFSIVQRRIPHWDQPGTICFVTWRLADSLPAEVLKRIETELSELLLKNGLTFEQWNAHRQQLGGSLVAAIAKALFATYEKFIDQGYGSCLLANPKCAQIVIDSLLHFDEQRYFMTDIVVMPNHVHFLAAFPKDGMLKQCEDWKRFTARKINQELGRVGRLWQVDQFDRLVRDENLFDHYREYVANNPVVARIENGMWKHWQKEL